MYIETKAEIYTDAGQGIIDRLHKENAHENFVLNTEFKTCYFPSHVENLSLKFAFSGNEFYEYSRNKVKVTAGNFLVINQGQEHASWIESENWVNSFAIYFTPDFVATGINDLTTADEKLLDDPFHVVDRTGKIVFFQNLFPFTPDFLEEIAALKKFLEQTGGRETFLVNKKLNNIFIKFVRAHQTELNIEIKKIDAVKLSTKTEILKRLHIAKDMMESFYLKPLSIQDISRACYLSENLLLRYFKLVYEVSPHQFLINKRLEFAKTQLISTNNTFNEITYAAGFECPSSFGRLFKERFGHTPNELRKMSKMEAV